MQRTVLHLKHYCFVSFSGYAVRLRRMRHHYRHLEAFDDESKVTAADDATRQD